MYFDDPIAPHFHFLQTNIHEKSKESIWAYTGLDFQRPYFCCQTGFPDYIYKPKFGYSGQQYQQQFGEAIHPAVMELLKRHQLHGICYMIGFTHKEIVVVFQALDDTPVSSLAVSEKIDSLIQTLYADIFPVSHSRYQNVTALSDQVCGVNGVQLGCEQTEFLKRLSFFRMASGVLTAERLHNLQNAATYRDAMNLARSLCHAAAQGEDASVLALAERLFLDLLKHSFDMELVRDALSYIKQFLAIRLSVHLPEDHTDLTALCSPSSYIIIEECCEAILPVLTRLCHAVRRSGAWSDSVAYAAYFLRSNLGKDVSLPEIAAFADTTPAYLSNLFHQQTGMTIKQYQQSIRMEQACMLLETTSDKVTDIAAQTGFLDRRYFTRTFKKTYGMTPQEYRQQRAGE